MQWMRRHRRPSRPWLEWPRCQIYWLLPHPCRPGLPGRIASWWKGRSRWWWMPRTQVAAIGCAIADEDEDVLGAGKGSLFGDERGLGAIDCAGEVGALAARVAHRGATARASHGLNQVVAGGGFGGGVQGGRGVGGLVIAGEAHDLVGGGGRSRCAIGAPGRGRCRAPMWGWWCCRSILGAVDGRMCTITLGHVWEHEEGDPVHGADHVAAAVGAGGDRAAG